MKVVGEMERSGMEFIAVDIVVVDPDAPLVVASAGIVSCLRSNAGGDGGAINIGKRLTDVSRLVVGEELPEPVNERSS